MRVASISVVIENDCRRLKSRNDDTSQDQPFRRRAGTTTRQTIDDEGCGEGPSEASTGRVHSFAPRKTRATIVPTAATIRNTQQIRLGERILQQRLVTCARPNKNAPTVAASKIRGKRMSNKSRVGAVGASV